MHVRQPLVGLMVVDDDHVGTHPARHGQRLEAGGAAVDRHDQPCAVRHEPLNGRGIGSVTLEQAVGNVDAAAEAVMRHKAMDEGDRRGAVDVVVAKNGYRLAGDDGVGQPRRGFIHILQDAGIRHQGLDRRIKDDRHLVEPYATGRQDTAEEFRQVVVLADGRGEIDVGRVNSLAPVQSADGLRDAEKSYSLAVDQRWLELPQCPHSEPPKIEYRSLHEARGGEEASSCNFCG